MKDSSSTAKKLLDLPYAPEAEAYLDELERSGQFRIGLEAEIEDAEAGESAQQRLLLGPRLRQRLDPGLVDHGPRRACASARDSPPRTWCWRASNDSLVLRTQDGLDRVTLEGYLGLIPDASTLRIIFNDGTEWAAREAAVAHRELAGRSPTRRPCRNARTRCPQYGSKSSQRDRLASLRVDDRGPEPTA